MDLEESNKDKIQHKSNLNVSDEVRQIREFMKALERRWVKFIGHLVLKGEALGTREWLRFNGIELEDEIWILPSMVLSNKSFFFFFFYLDKYRRCLSSIVLLCLSLVFIYPRAVNSLFNIVVIILLYIHKGFFFFHLLERED